MIRKLMDVSCPACAARYKADDEKLRGKTARMRCKACNTVWVVSGASEEAFPMTHAPIENESGAKRAAVMKKGADREQRDLFAQRESEVGSFKQTVLPAPSFGLTGVGARNENSVLFRVDQLTGAGRLKTPPPGNAPDVESRTAPPGGDDDGVIDLKSLSSTAARNIAVPVAPLFSEPPPVAVDVDDTQAPLGRFANKKRLFVGIAAAAAVLLVGGLGISLAFKGEEPVQPTAATVAAPPAETVTPPPAEPAPAPVASTADESSAKDAKESAKDTKGKKGKAGRGKATKSVATAAKAAAPAAKPAPKAPDPCGCKGDFNCVIACSAKGGK